MLNQFTVQQEKGKDSTVEIYQVTIQDWPRDKQALVFVTDQSLQSNSERTWNVEKAIENYAHPKGYQRDKSFDEKNKLTFIYSPEFHSGQIEFSIREQIKNDERYKSAASDAIQETNYINSKYGEAISQLKDILHQLEEKNRNELKQVAQDLIQTQVLIANEIDIPNELLEHHRKFIFDPSHPYIKLEMDHYRKYNYDESKRLDWILELL